MFKKNFKSCAPHYHYVLMCKDTRKKCWIYVLTKQVYINNVHATL